MYIQKVNNYSRGENIIKNKYLSIFDLMNNPFRTRYQGGFLKYHTIKIIRFLKGIKK